MGKEAKRTALHSWHLEHGANMADFGGYEMPLWYSSAKNEHLSVLRQAGLFDTSHMAALIVSGTDAHELLQRCFTNNLDACIGPSKKPLSPGRSVYGAFLDEKGGVVDDSIINQLSDRDYMVVVNAGMGGEVAAHLKSNKGTRKVVIDDLTDRLGKIDLQGPAAAKILQLVLSSPGIVFDTMPYFSFKGHYDPDSPASDSVRLNDGTPILLSRTGYTGEFGFEIFVAPGQVLSTWKRIYEAGQAFGLMTCGLAARDSLRGGAVLPLSHQDIGHWPFINHPWPFALPYNADGSGFTKSFIGDQALLNARSADFTQPFVGGDLRKVSTTDPAVVLDLDGNEIGNVLTCVSDMGIGYHEGSILSIASPDNPEGFNPRGLCCGFIKVRSQLVPGTVVYLKDNRRKIKVTIVEDVRPDRTARRPMKKML